MTSAIMEVQGKRVITNCYLCQLPQLEILLDLGPQPISTRFLTSRRDENPTHPLQLAVCKNCGMVQLVNPPPATLLRPQVDWLTYNEPEAHLDSLVGEINRLAGISSQSVIAGVSFKEDTTLARFNRLGYGNTWRIVPVDDLGADVNWVGVETIQERLTPECARAIAAHRGLADVVVARHILEHAHQPSVFLEALQELVKPGGYVVLEVPDCSRALGDLDYTTLWEEHTLYFTPLLLTRFAE
jgi:hypothetical protein